MVKKIKGRPTGRIGGIRTDKDLTNAEKIIFGLKGKGHTICTVESCTAGGFGYALTRVPGSSKVYRGGVVTYTRESKKQLLNLPDELLDSGLVTPEITLAMAKAALKIFNTDHAVAITGNAGPTSDTGGAGVGTVYWAIASRTGREKSANYDIFGNRDDVRRKAVTEGLRFLRNYLHLDED